MMDEIKNEYFFIDPDDGHKIDLCEKNRPLVLSHVKKIEKSLRKNSSLFLTPIMVGYRNGIIEIIDGHHRWKAINNLYKEGIKYDLKGNRIRVRVQILPTDVDLDELMIAINNSSLKWSILNFVQFNACRGNEHCTRFLNFMETNEISSIGYAFAYFGKTSLGRRQAEDFDKFPNITQEMVEGAQAMYKLIKTILSDGGYNLLKALKLNTVTGTRVFVQFVTSSIKNVEDLEDFIGKLLTTRLTATGLMKSFRSEHPSTSDLYLRDLYEHLYELLNN